MRFPHWNHSLSYFSTTAKHKQMLKQNKGQKILQINNTDKFINEKVKLIHPKQQVILLNLLISQITIIPRIKSNLS